MDNSALEEDLAGLGWFLSSEGLSKCQNACKEKGWTLNPKNIGKIALDMDLRSVGVQSLPAEVVRSMSGEAHGPLVLQIQRLKNVAVPSTKQHLPSPNRRMLRLQLADGKEYISAVESDGPIDKLSPTTPPGTKIRLRGVVSVANGFLLLTRSGVEVLGGQVEVLLKKWSLNKGMSDISRDRTRTTSGPPPFVPLKDYHTKKNARDAIFTSKHLIEQSKIGTDKHTLQSKEEKVLDKPTREQMDKPKERVQRKPDRKPEAVAMSKPPYKQDDVGTKGQRQGRGRKREDDDDDYRPQSRPKAEYQLSDWFSKKLTLSEKLPHTDPSGTRSAAASQQQTKQSNNDFNGYDKRDTSEKRGQDGRRPQDREGKTNWGTKRAEYDQRNKTTSDEGSYGSKDSTKSREKRSYQERKDIPSGRTHDRTSSRGHSNDRPRTTQNRQDIQSCQTHDDRTSSRGHGNDRPRTTQDRQDILSGQTHDDGTSSRGYSNDRPRTTQDRRDILSGQTHDDRTSSRGYSNDRPQTSKREFDRTAPTKGAYKNDNYKGREKQSYKNQRRTDNQSSSERRGHIESNHSDTARKTRDTHSGQQQKQINSHHYRENERSRNEGGAGHWDWVGSSSSAVPFSAKRQN